MHIFSNSVNNDTIELLNLIAIEEEKMCNDYSIASDKLSNFLYFSSDLKNKDGSPTNQAFKVIAFAKFTDNDFYGYASSIVRYKAETGLEKQELYKKFLITYEKEIQDAWNSYTKKELKSFQEFFIAKEIWTKTERTDYVKALANEFIIEELSDSDITYIKEPETNYSFTLFGFFNTLQKRLD